jgi:hypothetical protein
VKTVYLETKIVAIADNGTVITSPAYRTEIADLNEEQMHSAVVDQHMDNLIRACQDVHAASKEQAKLAREVMDSPGIMTKLARLIQEFKQAHTKSGTTLRISREDEQRLLEFSKIDPSFPERLVHPVSRNGLRSHVSRIFGLVLEWDAEKTEVI